MDPLEREIYQSQTAPSKHVGKSQHRTVSGYPNNLKLSQKLTMNAIGSVNLDCEVPNVLTLGRSEWGDM
jgi:hypothetical protein